MSELIQKISASLVKKFKEVASPDEKIHFCIEGVKGNALIGTNKKVYSITSGSFKGTLCYSFNYDNIVDIKVIPPLHGDHITFSIIPQTYDDKELKQRLYFQPEQNELLKQVLTKISSLSKTYTYIEPIKEISIHQNSNEFIVPMKNILGKLYEKNIKSSEKVFICLSIGDHQGLVCTNERLIIFKVNEDKTCKTGIFPLEEITDVEHSIGLVTGYIQIITPKVKVIKKKLREQELMNIENIISFGKKNYGELMDDLYKRLEEIIKNARRKKDSSQNIQEISIEKDTKKVTGKKNKYIEEPDEISTSIDDLEVEPDLEITPSPQGNMPSLNEIAKKLSEEILEEIKTDEQSFYYTVDIVKQIAQEVVKHSFPELLAGTLPGIITEYVMKYLEQNKPKDVKKEPDILLDETAEFDTFDDMEFSEMVFDDFDVEQESEKPKEKPVKLSEEKNKLPVKSVPLKPEKSNIKTQDTVKPSIKPPSSETKEKIAVKDGNTDKIKASGKPDTGKDGKFREKLSSEKISVIEKKLGNFTSLKNISATLLIDNKQGTIICRSIVEGTNYDKSSKVAHDIIKLIKSSRQAMKGNFIPQWKTEYEQGIVYIEELNLNYLLMIVGTEKSNFATLKMFIEKHKEELKKELK